MLASNSSVSRYLRLLLMIISLSGLVITGLVWNYNHNEKAIKHSDHKGEKDKILKGRILPVHINRPTSSKRGYGIGKLSIQKQKPIDASLLLPIRSSAIGYNFSGFNNVTGVNETIVPNIVHFIRLGRTEVRFVEALCLKAAFLVQKPDSIYIHTNNGTPTGRYWDWLNRIPKFREAVRIKTTVVPTHVFGQLINPAWRYFHGGDLIRQIILMTYGGIYLDNDVFLVRNLNEFRYYEMTLNWDEGQYIGSQILVAHRDARFLREWFETYRQYRPDLWYYNAGQRPTEEVLLKHPELIHRVKVAFGVDTNFMETLYLEYWPQWRQMYAMHLLVNHRVYILPEDYSHIQEFNETNIMNYNTTFGEMAREMFRQ